MNKDLTGLLTTASIGAGIGSIAGACIHKKEFYDSIIVKFSSFYSGSLYEDFLLLEKSSDEILIGAYAGLIL